MWDGAGQRLLCALVREVTPQVDILRPNSRRQRALHHHRYGLSAWMHLANGKGRCPPLCGPDTEQ